MIITEEQIKEIVDEILTEGASDYMTDIQKLFKKRGFGTDKEGNALYFQRGKQNGEITVEIDTKLYPRIVKFAEKLSGTIWDMFDWVKMIETDWTNKLHPGKCVFVIKIK